MTAPTPEYTTPLRPPHTITGAKCQDRVVFKSPDAYSKGYITSLPRRDTKAASQYAKCHRQPLVRKHTEGQNQAHDVKHNQVGQKTEKGPAFMHLCMTADLCSKKAFLLNKAQLSTQTTPDTWSKCSARLKNFRRLL